MTERQFTTKIIKHLRFRFPNCWIYKSNDRFSSGIPDIIICIVGKFLTIEVKRDEKSKITPLQDFTLKSIKNAGGLAIVIRGGPNFTFLQLDTIIHNFLNYGPSGPMNLSDYRHIYFKSRGGE